MIKNNKKIEILIRLILWILVHLWTFGICFAETDPFAENDAQVEDILAQAIPQIWMYPKTKLQDDDDEYLDTWIRYTDKPGVGPMTRALLLANVVEAAERRAGIG